MATRAKQSASVSAASAARRVRGPPARPRSPCSSQPQTTAVRSPSCRFAATSGTPIASYARRPASCSSRARRPAALRFQPRRGTAAATAWSSITTPSWTLPAGGTPRYVIMHSAGMAPASRRSWTCPHCAYVVALWSPIASVDSPKTTSPTSASSALPSAASRACTAAVSRYSSPFSAPVKQLDAARSALTAMR